MNGERSATIPTLGELAVRLALAAGRADVPDEVRAILRQMSDDLAEHGDAREKFILRTGGTP